MSLQHHLIGLVVFAFVIAIPSSTGEEDPLREWTSASGKVIVASLINDDGIVVRLRTANGKSVRIKRAKLSEIDIEYLDSIKGIASTGGMSKGGQSGEESDRPGAKESTFTKFYSAHQEKLKNYGKSRDLAVAAEKILNDYKPKAGANQKWHSFFEVQNSESYLKIYLQTEKSSNTLVTAEIRYTPEKNGTDETGFTERLQNYPLKRQGDRQITILVGDSRITLYAMDTSYEGPKLDAFAKSFELGSIAGPNPKLKNLLTSLSQLDKRREELSVTIRSLEEPLLAEFEPNLSGIRNVLDDHEITANLSVLPSNATINVTIRSRDEKKYLGSVEFYFRPFPNQWPVSTFTDSCAGFPAKRMKDRWVYVAVGNVEVRISASDESLYSDKLMNSLVRALDLQGLKNY